MHRPTSHSTGREISLPLIENLRVIALCVAPVNSGVRCSLDYLERSFGMKSFSSHALAYVAALCCAVCFIVPDCKAQMVSVNPSDNRVMRERITSIFRETLKQGESAVEDNGRRQVTSTTFVPPSTEHVDEMYIPLR